MEKIMRNELRIAIFSLILLTAPMVSVRQSEAQISRSAPASLTENEGRINAWLTSAGLAKSFDIIRIGEGPHPDPHYAFDGMIQHLELRFVTASSDRAAGAARFEKLLADYQRAHASALSEKLLYEFVDVFTLDPRNACVDLHLYDTSYYIYFSRSDGSLVVSKDRDRAAAYDPFSVTIPALAPQEQFHSRLGPQSAPNPKAVGDAVEKFLRAYLGSVQNKSGPKPEILTDVHRQDGYLRLLVNGARGMVTDGYWEWLDIAVFFHQDPAAENGKDTRWDFVCNVEVKYASGPRETHPTDADFDYPKQVADFRTRLGQQLQASLEKGIHD
jgi:hypothetical protein